MLGFISVLFGSCWESPSYGVSYNYRIVDTVNNSSYDLYIVLRDIGSIGKDIASGEEGNLHPGWSHDKDDTNVGAIDFYYSVPYEHIGDTAYPMGERVFIRRIENGNSVVTILRDEPYLKYYRHIYYQLVITNEMLGLPDLSEEEQP
jgi:hypothetical protein